MKADVISLFADDSEIALLYFAGHGHVEDAGGYLVTSECSDGDDGLPLEEVMNFANESKAKNKILILDSCYSGAAGTPKSLGDKALLSEGMTILTASSKDQYAQEANGSGVFTSLLVDAMNGGGRKPPRRHYARQHLRSHRSIARGLGAAPYFQDKREGVYVVAQGGAADSAV